MRLDADCWTDASILVPAGFTLDGGGHTITAIDPPGGHFRGAVVRNAGSSASVEHLTIVGALVANVCDDGGDRLRGIMLDAASGTLAHNRVLGINQGPSGCQEGNAIEIRNCDGASPTTTARVLANEIEDYQKTGVVANCDVSAEIRENHISSSATQANLAANGIQVGFGATAIVRNNEVGGNSWCGGGGWSATAVLLYQSAPGTIVTGNNTRGNADVGIYVYADGAIVNNNRVFETGADCNTDDDGIGSWGTGNIVTNNKVRGYDTPYDGVTGGGNKTIPSPHK